MLSRRQPATRRERGQTPPTWTPRHGGFPCNPLFPARAIREFFPKLDPSYPARVVKLPKYSSPARPRPDVAEILRSFQCNNPVAERQRSFAHRKNVAGIRRVERRMRGRPKKVVEIVQAICYVR